MATSALPSQTDFRIAIICALQVEVEAIYTVLDKKWKAKYSTAEADTNSYRTGVIGDHNVVIVWTGGMGPRNAGTSASHLLHSFPNIRLALIVGICGGVPIPASGHAIHLGDLIISSSAIEFDYGRQYKDRLERRTGTQYDLAKHDAKLCKFVGTLNFRDNREELQASIIDHIQKLRQDEGKRDRMPHHPGPDFDRLYHPGYIHKHMVSCPERICDTRIDTACQSASHESCGLGICDIKTDAVCRSASHESCDSLGCENSGRIIRRGRSTGNSSEVYEHIPAIHVGAVACGNAVMKSAEHRDILAWSENVIAFEMEGHGVWDQCPSIIIKAVCDYADSHKSKEWQEYAAAIAAVSTKAVLQEWGPLPVSQGQALDKAKPYRYLPLQRKSQTFVGREAIIKTLEERLFGNNSCQRVAITGLGGVGKTQVALHLADRLSSEWSVFWIPAVSMVSFEQACRKISQQLGLEGAEKDDAKEVLHRHLESAASGQWLLIVDNADDEEVMGAGNEAICSFLPCNEEGRILFTTRIRHVAVQLAQKEVINLLPMNTEEGKELLEKSLTDRPRLTDKQSVSELLEILTYLPLAIIQAAAYLNETTTPLPEYIWLLQHTERDMVELLETEFADDTRYPEAQNAVAKTWVTSFKQIQKNADAAMLLSFISHIDSEAIPRFMLPAVGSEQKMTRAIGVLCGYSFLGRREDGSTFDMHRLVHLASQVWLATRNNASDKRHVALKHLVKIFSTDDWEEREKWRHLLPHIMTAVKVGEDRNWGHKESHLRYWLGRCLLVEGQIRGAVKVLEQVVAICKTTLAETHPDRLASQHVLAIAYQANGQVAEAIPLLEQVVAIQETTLAETHPDRLASQHTLAIAYQANGRVAEAIPLLEQVVAIRKTTLAETHLDRLASQHELAVAYQADRQVKEAILLLEQVVVIKETTLAETHPSRLASQHELTRAYQADRRVAEAIPLLEQVVVIKETTLAETHPSRLVSQHELARAYQADGRVAEAIPLLEQVVAIQETTLAKTHPSRLVSQHTLAGAYQANGQVAEAIALVKSLPR